MDGWGVPEPRPGGSEPGPWASGELSARLPRAKCRKRVAYFDGVPEQVARMRSWCAHAMELDRDRSVLPLLVFSELVTNALRHTASGDRYGRVRTHIEMMPADIVLMGIGDDGPKVGKLPTLPKVHHAADDCPGGRGLYLVSQVSECWWWTGSLGRPLTVWAMIDADRRTDF